MKKFDIDKALAGEPVILRNGQKAIVKFQQPNGKLVGYILGDNELISWRIDGLHILEPMKSIEAMWQLTRTVNGIKVPLPLARNELKLNTVYYVPSLIENHQHYYSICYNDSGRFDQLVNDGLLFREIEDAQRMARALLNYKQQENDGC